MGAFFRGCFRACLLGGAMSCAALAPALAQFATTTQVSPLTGLWYNEAEPGWGMSLAQHGSMIFAAWYTFDAAGRPAWYVMSSCPIVGASCEGQLFRVTGGRALTEPWAGAAPAAAPAGTGRLTFTGNDSASFSFVLDGRPGTRALSRQMFGPAGAERGRSDLWWKADESGWGIALTQQGATIFATLYTYDGGGNPRWYVASNCALAGDACSGELYEVTGGTEPTRPWDGANRQVSAVGTLRVQFQGADRARIDYAIGAARGAREITRQAFGGDGLPVARHAEVFQAVNAASNSGYRGRGIVVTDDLPIATASCGEETISGRAESEAQILANGGRITTSTDIAWCAEMGPSRMCLRLFGPVVVLDQRDPQGDLQMLFMPGLVDGRLTAVNLLFGPPALLEARIREAPIAPDAPCPAYTQPEPAREQLNGSWAGYEASYSLASETARVTRASMACANLACTILGARGGSFQLNAASGVLATAPGAPRVAGATMTFDAQLASVYLCDAPLEEARTLESCSFYSFRRH